MPRGSSNRWTRLRDRRRNSLLERLGSKCALCPETDPSVLEFDHPNGRDFFPSELSSHERMKRYEKDAEEGNLRLLCKTCNTKDGARRGHEKRWGNGRSETRS